jgi:membrane protein YdbS with pleckstrin-like domain
MTSLHGGQLWVMRVHALIAGLVLLAAAAIAELVLQEKTGLPRGVAIAPASIGFLWLVLIAPQRRYRAWGYTISPFELQLRRGILTRLHTLVPLDRVQHLDIAQGPLERAFGVCRLIVHTAGTAHSQVTLPGLSRATAEAMRDEIRTRIGEEGR